MPTPTIACPSCGRLFNATFAACPFCRAPAPRREPPKGQPVKCPACGRLINASFTECPFCKGKITPAPQPGGIDFAAVAEQAVEHNQKFLDLDFSPASVYALDVFFDEMWGTEGYAPDDETWQPKQGQAAVIFSFGIYFAEVLRRRYGGAWRMDPQDPKNLLMSTVFLPGNHGVFAVAKVFKRLKNGSEDALYALLLSVRHSQGDTPKATELGEWLRQARFMEKVHRYDHALKFYDVALALPLSEENRSAVKAMRDLAEAECPKEEPQAKITGETLFPVAPSSKPAPDFKGGEEELAPICSATGILPNHSPASIAALDVWLDVLIGREPLSEEKKQAYKHQEWMVGCYLGELFCKRLGAKWRPDAEHPDCSHVTWPSGFVTCPFVYPSKRMERGAEHSLFKQFEMCRNMLRERGDLPPDGDEGSEWMDQAEAFAKAISRFDLAVSFARRALQFYPDSAEIHSRIGDWITGVPDQLEKALPWYDKALSLSPSLPSAWLGKAYVLQKMGRPQEAMACLERAPAADAQHHFLRGEILKALERPVEALAEYRAVQSLDGSLIGAWLGAADCLEAAGDAEGTLRALASASLLPTCSPAVFLRKGACEERLGRKDEALESYRRARHDVGMNDPLIPKLDTLIAALENTPERWRKKAEDFSGAGKLKEAVEAYGKLLELDPSDAEAWRERGVGLALMQSFEEALRCLDRAIALDPGDPKSYDHKAVSLARSQRLPEALLVLEAGLAEIPGNPKLLKRRGIFRGMAGRPEDAVEDLDRALAADPEDPEPLFYRAGYLHKMGDQAEAARALKAYCDRVPAWTNRMAMEARKMLWGLQNPGKQLQPEVASQFSERAWARLQRGDVQGGLADLDEALKANPFSGEDWLNRGTSLSQLGRAEEALSSYNHALELLGNMSIILQNKASVLRSLGRWDEALACHEQVLEVSPDDADSLRGKAAALGALERHEEALSCHERRLAKAPRESKVWADKGTCLGKLKRFEEALEAFDRAIALDPANKRLLLSKSLVLGDMGRGDEAFALQSEAFEDKKFADEWEEEGRRLLGPLFGADGGDPEDGGGKVQ